MAPLYERLQAEVRQRRTRAMVCRKRKSLNAVSYTYFRRLIKQNIQQACMIQELPTETTLSTDSSKLENAETIPGSSYLKSPNKGKAAERPLIDENLQNSEASAVEPKPVLQHSTKATENNESNVQEELAKWVILFNINHVAVNYLLKIINTNFRINLPDDSRRLLRTRTFSNCIISVPPGNYWHFGVEKGIQYAMKKNRLEVLDTIKIDINIDGLPLTKSSTSQLWPILGSILRSDGQPTLPFVIGIYHGTKKPETPHDLMREFILEFNNIRQEFKIKNESTTLALNNIICDAPAKAFLLGVKSHNAYFGCTKCIQEGSYIQGKMTYPETAATLRTDDSFKRRLQEDFHKTSSPLSEISNVGLISQVPLDYMHLVCLGVMKKLLVFWVKGKKDLRMLDSNIQKCTALINQIAKQVPKEFARKPRPLIEVDRWKATEFRLFLLYIGPVVLKDTLLTNSQYVHFMALHVAIRILICENLCIKFNDYARNLLLYFVQKYSSVYGAGYITHNVHNLIHLCDDVLRNNGPLDHFASFRYENYLQNLKKKIKSSKCPLQQVANRIQEEQLFDTPIIDNFPLLNGSDSTTDVPSNLRIVDSYTSLKTKEFALSLKDNNNCVMLKDGSIVIVNSILKSVDSAILLVGNRFNFINPYFDSPCSSVQVFTYSAKKISTINLTFSYKDIKYKCFKIKNPEANDEFIIVCLLHNINN